MDNLEEENSTTSSNGQSITLPEPNATTTDSAITKTYRISYKTELGKMTRSRNSWRFVAFFFCAAELLRVIIQHAIQS
jgi:hypothetical protein